MVDEMKAMDDMAEALAHHGILGQKWGVRRYQNTDGTLTEAGRARLGKLQSKADKYAEKANKAKQKVPSTYLTDFGKAKAEKYTRKAAAYEGKSIKTQNKIEKIEDKYEKNRQKMGAKTAYKVTKSAARLYGFRRIQDLPLLEYDAEKFMKNLEIANKNYNDVSVMRITKEGKQYIETLLTDKTTGNIYKMTGDVDELSK